MRTVFQTQMMIGTVPIEEIELDLKSRDDVIAYLYGLQQIFKDPRTRKKLFTALATILWSARIVDVREWTCGGSWY